MRKFNWVLSTLLLSAMISSVPTSASQVAKVQTNLSGSAKDIVQASFSKDNIPPTDPREGAVSRGPCTIAPLDLKTNTEVWSDRPMFLWRGPIGKIEVRQQGSNDVLWRQPIEPGAWEYPVCRRTSPTWSNLRSGYSLTCKTMRSGLLHLRSWTHENVNKSIPNCKA
jgi:hypothetical protein